MEEDTTKALPGNLSLFVMKALLFAREYERVLDIYRKLRIRRYIGRGGAYGYDGARMTTMASCFAAQAAEVS